MISAEDYIMPCVKADAVYENKYLLGTSMARPAIAQEAGRDCQEKKAQSLSATALPVRAMTRSVFELGIKALAPDVKIIAPWRMVTNGTCSPVKMRSHTASTRHPSSV